MEVPLVLTIGVLFGAGLYLVLQRNLLRFVFGLILMSGAVNLSLFVVGRLTRAASPFVPVGQYVPNPGSANPLPQALILTAIVISFGLTVFAMVLLLRTYERLGTVESNEMTAHLLDPKPVGGAAAAATSASGPRGPVPGPSADIDPFTGEASSEGSGW